MTSSCLEIPAFKSVSLPLVFHVLAVVSWLVHELAIERVDIRL
jgi:hypothetical protein